MPWSNFAKSLPKPFWEQPIENFAKSVSLPGDQVIYLSALLMGIPIGLIFRMITTDPYTCKTPEAKAHPSISCLQPLLLSLSLSLSLSIRY